MAFINQGGSKREASKIFGIGEDTIYRWIRRDNKGELAPKKRIKYPQKVDCEVLLRYVKENPDHTLKEISQALQIGVKTAWKWLKRLNITRKKKTTFYHERDEHERLIFQEKLKKIDPKALLYLDEAGVDNRLFRRHARAIRGQKICVSVPGKKRERYSMIGGG